MLFSIIFKASSVNQSMCLPVLRLVYIGEVGRYVRNTNRLLVNYRICSIRASLRCRQNDFNRDRCLQLIVRTGRSEFVGGLLGSFYAGEIASLARGARLQALPLSLAPYHAQRQTTNSKQRTMNDEHWWTSDDRQKNYGLRIPDDGRVATTVWQLFNTSSLLLCLLLIFFFLLVLLLVHWHRVNFKWRTDDESHSSQTTESGR